MKFTFIYIYFFYCVYNGRDLDDSVASELDCSAIIENSDSEHIPLTESKQSTSRRLLEVLCRMLPLNRQ